MIRNVPCVAGCWGPMLRVMPSVSSSTLSRASAACRGDVRRAARARRQDSVMRADPSWRRVIVAAARVRRQRSVDRRPRRRVTLTAVGGPKRSLDVHVVVGGRVQVGLARARRRLLDAVLGAASSATSSAGGRRALVGLTGDLVLRRRLLGRHRLDVDDAGPRLDHAGQQREVLAQRVALELRRQVHVAQVGVAGEGDAEHLVGLPLVPVGAGVDGEPGVDGHRVVGDVDLERDARRGARVSVTRAKTWNRVSPPVTPCTISVAALGRRLGRVVLAAAVRRRHPVERRQEAEVVEAHRQRAPRRPGRQASVATRTHRSSFGRSSVSTRASPMRRRSSSTMPSRSPSPGSAWAPPPRSSWRHSNRTTADDDRLAARG